MDSTRPPESFSVFRDSLAIREHKGWRGLVAYVVGVGTISFEHVSSRAEIAIGDLEESIFDREWQGAFAH
jgi:hypothetical protein